MVDKTQIRRLLKAHYYITGKVTILSNGEVDVAGSVTVRHVPSEGHLSVQFNEVKGNFEFLAQGVTLQDLTGCPRWVAVCLNARTT